MEGSYPRDLQEDGTSQVTSHIDRRAVLRRLGGSGLLGATFLAVGSAGALATDQERSEQPPVGRSESDAGEVPGQPEELVVPPATGEDLAEPDPALAGRLRRRTDDNRSVWLDTGAGWVNLGGYSFDVRAFGARGDGETDDWSAFQAAIEAMSSPLLEESTTPYGRTLLVPPGRYRLAQTLVLTRAVRLVGAGTGPESDVIVAPDAGIIGIIVAAADPATGGPNGRRGQGAIIERLRIEASGAPHLARGARTTSAAHGVWLRTRATLRHCAIVGFAGDGIHIETTGTGNGAAESTPADGWTVEQCRVASCGGHGLAVRGASAGLCAALEATDNGGWGIHDESPFGNTYLQCRAERDAQGPFRTVGGGNRSVFLACLSGRGQPPSDFADGTIVVGGRHGAGYAGGNAWTANGSRALLIAQDPGAEEGGIETAPTLRLVGMTRQRQPHLLVSDPAGTRQVELDASGRLFIGPLAPDASVGGSPRGATARLHISGNGDGMAGIRWVITDEVTDFSGWAAQASAVQEPIGPDSPGGFGSLRLTFQTPAPDGSELDTLTLRGGRVGVGTTAPAAALEIASTASGFLPPRLTTAQRDAIPNPPEGSLIYNLSTHRLNVHDGTQWREIDLVPAGG